VTLGTGLEGKGAVLELPARDTPLRAVDLPA
jgi:hypothetical protein